jgi:hypothetical protein
MKLIKNLIICQYKIIKKTFTTKREMKKRLLIKKIFYNIKGFFDLKENRGFLWLHPLKKINIMILKLN